MTTKAIGDAGEAETARYLRGKGYTLLASQWRCRFGEIDLIARDKTGLLCFVEVKLRSNLSAGLPREFVDARKQEKLRCTASCYLSRYELDEPVRFDVAEVYTDGNGRILRTEYLENAF
jgi:putative endonuclease